MNNKYLSLAEDFEALGERVRRGLMEAWGLCEGDLWWTCGTAEVDELYICYLGCLNIGEAVYCLRRGVSIDEFVRQLNYNDRVALIRRLHPGARIYPINIKGWHECQGRYSEEDLDRFEAFGKKV